MRHLCLPLLCLGFSASACHDCTETYHRISVEEYQMLDTTSFEGSFLGLATIGFETSSFTPCGGQEHWWVEGVEIDAAIWEAIGRPEATREAWAQRMMRDWPLRERHWARVRGRVKTVAYRDERRYKEMRQGHMGEYGREIEVYEVEVVAPFEEGACPDTTHDLAL